jgi:hypothetical protein
MLEILLSMPSAYIYLALVAALFLAALTNPYSPPAGGGQRFRTQEPVRRVPEAR